MYVEVTTIIQCHLTFIATAKGSNKNTLPNLFNLKTEKRFEEIRDLLQEYLT